MNHATLCIVMPVLNEAAALPLQLAALQPLRRRGVRLIVVDGGSSDDSAALARQGADEVLHSRRGRAAQMNAGAAASDAEVLLFLHADSRLPAAADAAVLRALRGDDAGQHGAQWGRFDVRIDSPRHMLAVVSAAMNLRSRWSGIATGDQALFVRRELFARAGGFAEIALMEDVELCTRLKRHGPPACLRDKVLTSARRWEQHGVWRTIGLMWRLRAAYFFGADPTRLAQRYGYGPRSG
ncbi:MAG: TIGR04283 family arsenosugar biosynthesis glycosyltransferase [Rubrivivax sp.]